MSREYKFLTTEEHRKNNTVKYNDYQMKDELLINAVDQGIDFPDKIIKNPLNNCQMGSIAGVDACETVDELRDFIKIFRNKTMKNMVLFDISNSKLHMIGKLFEGVPEENINEYIKVCQGYKSTRGTSRVLVLLACNNKYFI